MTQLIGAFGSQVPSKWSIRYACTRGDFGRLMSIERAAFDPPLSDVDFLKLLQPPNTTLVYEADYLVAGAVVHGVLGFVAFRVDADQGCVDVVKIVVDPYTRRQRIATRLLRKTVGFATTRFHEIRSVRMAVPERAVTAQLWLREIGFKCVGTVHGVQADGTDSYTFVKDV